MKILLADDHTMVRAGLRLLLSRLFKDAEIVEAGDYDQALALCFAHKDLALILLDRNMPGMHNGNSLGDLCAISEDVPVVILSASEDPMHVRDALDRGARGYLPKTTTEPVMFSALQLILSGGVYLPAALLERMNSHEAESMARRDDHPALTPRQLDILQLLALGKTNKDIAREFAISPATVQTHINAIFRTLDVTNRTRAVHIAGQLGLIETHNR